MNFFNLILITICILFKTFSTYALDSSDLTIIVLSQSEGYHAAYANSLRDDINEQAKLLEKEPPEVALTHELDLSGAWVVGPMLPRLSQKYSRAKWFFFCEDNTAIRLGILLNLLATFNSTQELWIGHALYDHEPTIIHHFADHAKRFKYPNIASGFGMTAQLVNSLAKRVSNGDGRNNDFSIDASYEFASFVLNAGKGVRLTHASKLCVASNSDCATYPRFFHPCDKPVSRDKVFVAIKTCSKYHVDRVPVIMKTWAKHATNIGFFTDKPDENLTNAYVVPNTDRGHCAKTYAILKHTDRISHSKELDWDWLIISDDDTILSLARLLRLLTCYNPANPVALGERYGFHTWWGTEGYDYLTGGAGLVLSRPVVHRIINSEKCICPTPSTPDDMFLFGKCLARNGLQPTHSPLFHQARPSDYATAYLASQEPISFHKFWMIDPEEVYEQWFSESDDSFFSTGSHTEL